MLSVCTQMRTTGTTVSTVSLSSSFAVSSSRPLPASSSGVLVVLIKYYSIISQESMDYLRVF
jgi:hypothetical protein